MIVSVFVASMSCGVLSGCDNSSATAPAPAPKQTPTSTTTSPSPSDTKPADPSAKAPATDTAAADKLDVIDTVIAGKTFHLEFAATNEVRTKGLMGRQTIAADGGMLFVFPRSQVRVQSFWMKNCLTDMDIIFLDGGGRALATHEMKIQPLQGKDPGAGPDESEYQYEVRVQKTASYSSRFPATFAIELAPGTVKKLGIKEGDKVEFDADALKAKAR